MTAPGDPPGLDELTSARPPDRSERGRILAPDLDDRRWQDLVDEASTLIDRYAPQWTDRNPSDVGMTVIELFAWLVENLIYRLNRVPEKNYVAFLNLLGITRTPARPARTLLTFAATAAPVEVPEHTPAQTPGSETEPPIVFETETALTVRALTAAGAVRVAHTGDPDAATYTALGALDGRAPTGIDVALPDRAGTQICLALKADTAPDGLDVYVEPFRPPIDRTAVERTEWVASPAGSAKPLAWTALEVVRDGTGGLARPGVVRLRAPAGTTWGTQDASTWSTQALEPSGDHRWLGLRITNASGSATPGPVRLRLDRLLVNTTPAAGVATIVGELVGKSTGLPRQTFRLARFPLYAQPGTDHPYGHVEINVAGEQWQAVDDLPDSAGTGYVLDPVGAEIRFGDHDPSSRRGRGTVPAKDAEIRATYRYVSGAATANVAPGVVTLLTRAPAGLTGVTNPVPAAGGVDEEPVEETKSRAPQVLRHRERAITADDYELLARAAVPGVVAIARCLPPRLHDTPVGDRQIDDPWTYGKLQRAPGVVNVIIVPDAGLDVPEPSPSLALKQDVIRYLDRRRPIGTALHVDGPRYVPVKVVMEIEVFKTAIDLGVRASAAAVKKDVERTLTEFLHPIRGGPQQRGWQIGESVSVTDVYQAVQLPAQVGFVTTLGLVPQTPRYFATAAGTEQRPIPDAVEPPPPDPANPGPNTARLQNQVRLTDYELICCGTLLISAPEPL